MHTFVFQCTKEDALVCTGMHRNAHECVRISECARMHLTVGSHRLIQEKLSGLKAKLT